jgi:hypothetical protein
MKKFVLLLLILVSINNISDASENPVKKLSQKLFSVSPPSRANASVNTLLYKPGKSKNYMWNNFGIGPGSWMESGGSIMSYNSVGQLTTSIDTMAFGSFIYYVSKKTISLDDQNRETGVLFQLFDTLSQNWTNNYRFLKAYDQFGMLREWISEQWISNNWKIMGGYRDFRTFDSQNRVIARLRTSYNSQDSAWVNEGRGTDYQYDNQNRLISYTEQEWNAGAFINREKIIIQYGADNKPNEAVLQDWNGVAFVDSSRITELQWFLWDGSVETSMPLSFVEQKKSGASWVNFEKQINSYSDFGGRVSLTQQFSNNQWVNSSRSSEVYDAQSNLVFSGDEQYLISSWDTLEGSVFNRHTYDGLGRIQETISKQMATITPPDQEPQTKWRFGERKLFSMHQAFTSVEKQLSTTSVSLQLQPNPVRKNEAFRLAGREGSILLTDVQGREVLRKEMALDEAISTADLRPGLFQIILNDKQGKISRGRLVVE